MSIPTIKPEYSAEEMKEREEAANTLLELWANPIVHELVRFPQTLKESKEEQTRKQAEKAAYARAEEEKRLRELEEAQKWEKEQEARVRAAAEVKEELQARMAEQERGSGMKVVNTRSTLGNPHRNEGRSDDLDVHRQSLHEHLPSDINNNISTDQAALDSNDDTISDSGTIPDPDAELGVVVCSPCGYNSKTVSDSRDPAACILASMMKKRQREHEEKQEKAAKKDATGREFSPLPSAALDDGQEHSASNIDNAVTPRPGSGMSTGTDESSNSKKIANLDIFSNLGIAIELGKAPLSHLRGLPLDDDNTNSHTIETLQALGQNRPPMVATTSGPAISVPDLQPMTANAIEEARRASAEFVSASLAGVDVAADTADLVTTSETGQLHTPTKGNRRTSSNASDFLFVGDALYLHISTFDHERAADTPTKSLKEDLLQDGKETSSVESEKGYEDPPPYFGAYDDKSVKEIARIKYSLDEDIDLEDSDNDVPDEHNPGFTRRRIANTPEDDYPEPVGGGDMRLPPEENVYVGAISGKLKSHTPREHLEARAETVWLLEIARLKERHAEVLKRAQGVVVHTEATVDREAPVTDGGEEAGAFPVHQ